MQLNINSDRVFGGYDLYETRGLGPWNRPGMFQLEGSFSTDRRREWQITPTASYTWHWDEGTGYHFALEGNWHLGTKLSLTGSLGGEWEKDATAWASNESFRRNGSQWMIGERSVSPGQLAANEYRMLKNPSLLNTIFSDISTYSNNTWYVPVFGSRDTRSLDLTLKSNITFMPKLSLQLYSQLFLARGRYGNFQIMQNRDQLVSYPSYPKRSEFSLGNLQSNLVLRWEYRPGSNIYLVWTHGQRLRDNLNPLAPYGPSPYDRSIGQSIQDIFDIFPDNAFMIKIEYLFLY